MLQPKRTKHRRSFRTKHDCVAARGKKLSFGAYGLQAVTSAWVTNRQIEATRIAITRAMGREGKVWIRIFPHLSKTTKPIGVRMGSGKGTPDKWVAVVKRETVMFEIDGINREAGLRALRLGKYKLPLKSRVIERKEPTC